MCFLSGCVDELPELANMNFCPGSRLEDGACPSNETGKSWDFSKSGNFSFDGNFVEFGDTGAKLKLVDAQFAESDFSLGSHVGTTSTIDEKLSVLFEDTRVDSILSENASSLVSYWRFDGNSNDSSSNAHNLVSNNINFSSNSPFGGSSAVFDGTSSHLTGAPSSVYLPTGASPFSFLAWVRPSEITSSTGNGNRIFTIHRGVNAGSSIALSLGGSNKLGYYDHSSGSWSYYSSGMGLNVWAMVGITYNGSCLQLYKNGMPVGGCISKNLLGGGSFPLHIGDYKGTDSLAFKGEMDELSFWSVGLSNSDVLKVYNQQVGSKVDKLESWFPHWDDVAGYWAMDGNWLDASGNDLDATVSGASLVTDQSSYVVGAGGAYFDGVDDYVTLPKVSELTGFSKLSISFWMNVKSGSPSKGPILDKNRLAEWSVHTGANSNKIEFEAKSVNGIERWRTLDQLPFNQWHHIVIVYDSVNSQRKIYVNGKNVPLDIDLTDGGSIVGTNNNIYLGKTSDNRHINGYIDEVAIINESLTSSDASLIYMHQKQKYSGIYTSTVMDISDVQEITDMIPITGLPFGKELTQTAESSSDYSTLKAQLNDGLIAYLPLNEKSGGVVSNFSDTNTNGSFENAVVLNQSAKLHSGVRLDRGTNSNISLSGLNLGNTFTLSAWINLKETSTEWQTIFANIGSGSEDGFRLGVNSWGTNDRKVILETSNSTLASSAETGTSAFTFNKWQHVVVTVNRSAGEAKIYINGLKKSVSELARTDFETSGTIRIGILNDLTGDADGLFDEIAIWNRLLGDGTSGNENEVLELYRRGASKVDYQLRVCADATCSGDPEWRGAGGDGTTYLSELFNKNSVDLDSSFSSCYVSAPDICDNTELGLNGQSVSDSLKLKLSDFPIFDMSPLQGQYFQYRVLLGAEDNLSCESGTKACVPSVSAVQFLPSSIYYGGAPSIRSVVPLEITGSVSSLKETTSAGCDIKYQFSKDGSNFFYYDSIWKSASDNASEANSASQISSKLNDFAEAGELYFRAYLGTTGSNGCELKGLTVIE